MGIGPLLAALLGIVSIPLMAWLFSPEEIGAFSIFQVVVSFSIVIFSLGLDSAYLREYHAEPDKGKLLKAVIVPSFCFMLTTFLVATVFELDGVAFIIFNTPEKYATFFLTLSCAVALAIRYISIVLRISDQYQRFAILNILPKFLQLSILLALIGRSELNVYWLISVYLVANIITSFIGLRFLRRELSEMNDCHFDFFVAKKNLKFGLPLALSGIFSLILMSLDKISIKYWSSLSELGVYQVAVSLTAGVAIFTNIFNTILAPHLYKIDQAGAYKAETRNTLNDSVLLVVVFAYIAFGYFSWLITKVLPVQYTGIDDILICSISVPLFYMLSEVSAAEINLKRKTHFIFLSVLISVSCAVVLNYFLVNAYGALGAAVASAITFYVFFATKLLFAKRVNNAIQTKKLLIWPLGVLGIAFIDAFNLVSFFSMIGIWTGLGIFVLIFMKRVAHDMYVAARDFFNDSTSL